MPKRFRYRAHQLWRIVRPRPLDELAWSRVRSILSPAEQTLFSRFDLGDRDHSVRVCRRLEAEGVTDRALLAAALLHDVGKTTVPLTALERILIVLADRFAPRLLISLGQGDPAGPWRAFVVKAQHASWGARLVEAAGSDPRTVTLIAHHQGPIPAGLAPDVAQQLRWLRRADDQE